MEKTQFALLADRRFMPLFITQFLGAFHDNLFKNAFVVLLLFSTATNAGGSSAILTTLAAGAFILPFVLFSALGGELAEKYPKHLVMRAIKIAELAIALLGTIALITISTPLSFATLFALGTHSALFSPSKYSILPQHLHENELIGGNALLNTGTFLAILTGTIIGTSVTTMESGTIIISAILFICSATGLASSYYIPATAAIAPEAKIHINILATTVRTLGAAFKQQKNTSLAILGIAWFYFMGGMYLAQLPNYVRETINGDEHILTLFLAMFSVFIALGGLLNNKLLKGRITPRLVPWAILGITLFSIDLYIAYATSARSEIQINLSSFFNAPANWRLLFDMAMIALCGGLFVVPLAAMIQAGSANEIRARIMAGSAIMNALFIVISTAISAILLASGLQVIELFLFFSLVNALVAALAYKIFSKHA